MVALSLRQMFAWGREHFSSTGLDGHNQTHNHVESPNLSRIGKMERSLGGTDMRVRMQMCVCVCVCVRARGGYICVCVRERLCVCERV